MSDIRDLIAGQKAMDVHNDGGPGAAADGDDHHQAQGPFAYQYTTVKGYFAQDEPSTNPQTFEFMKSNFGLLHRDYDSDATLPPAASAPTDWQRFYHHLTSLNKAAPSGVSYRLLFLGRHGNGYHNVAERYYGPQAWDCHFSALDGDEGGVMTWADAHLTSEGVRQAKDVNEFWKHQIQEAGMVLPESFYVSPLDRAMQTAEVTFGDILEHGFGPVVKERLREGTGIHTCDRRSRVAYIKHAYPRFIINQDPLLTERDEFWDKDLREPWDALMGRQKRLFDDLLETDPSTVISCTSHSGAIGAALDVFSHRKFPLSTGAVIPVLLKVEKVRDATILPRHGGDAEGLNNAGELHPPGWKNPEKGDQSHWEKMPACPHDMNLKTVGQDRWGMGLQEFLDKIINGMKVEDPAFNHH